MDTIKVLLEEVITERLIQVILSNAKNPDKASKVKMRPVVLKGEFLVQ